MNVSLVMFKADGTRRDFPVAKERIVIGRKSNCDLRIPLSSVSREHCEIRIDGDGVTLRDLGSSNGTFHNSVRVQEAMLAPGDEVVVGPVVFKLVIDGEPAEIEPVHTIIGGPTTSASLGTDANMSSSDQVPGADADADLSMEIEQEFNAATTDLDDPISALDELAEAEEQDDDEDDEMLFMPDEDEESRNSNK